MAKKIPADRFASFLGQKGGVGKSALARLLAVAGATSDRKVLLADFDVEQLTCVEWSRRRASAGVQPEIAAAPFQSLKKLRKVEGTFDLIVADARGLADGLTRDIAEESDVIFLPTSCSSDDLEPTLGLARRLADKGAAGRIVVIFSKIGRSRRQIDTAAGRVRAAGFELLSESWPARDGFQTELDCGRVGLESKNAPLRKAAEATARALLARVLAPRSPDQGAADRPKKPRAARVVSPPVEELS
jgi:chromosome partitioning protein